MAGDFIILSREPKLIEKLKVEIMKKKLSKEMSARTTDDSSTKVDDMQVSPAIAKPNLSGSLPSRQDFFKTMLDWHEEYFNAGHFNIPLDHEQSEYLSWLAARLAKVWGNDR